MNYLHYYIITHILIINQIELNNSIQTHLIQEKKIKNVYKKYKSHKCVKFYFTHLRGISSSEITDLRTQIVYVRLHNNACH